MMMETTTMMDLVYSFGVMNLGSLVRRECAEENVATCSSAAVSTMQTNRPPIKHSKLSLSQNNDGKNAQHNDHSLRATATTLMFQAELLSGYKSSRYRCDG